MRRAQGPDGALSASRAAYVGGCIATSNALAGKQYGIPVRGTHAHSWVTAFPDESAAFAAYAAVMPHHVVLLVDTYDTLTGIKHAIEVGKQLRQNNSDLYGIRLDSGDMGALSIQARQLLDAAGFSQTQIMASNSLDEYAIQKLKTEGAAISLWGVGTNLVTANDYPALDGVYKLSALCDEQGQWQYKLKISEDPIKASNPGIHQVRRYYWQGKAFIDVLYDIDIQIPEFPAVVLFDAAQTEITLTQYDHFIDLLVPVFRQGKCVNPPETIHQLRERALQNVTTFYQQQGDTPYPIALEKKLYDKKQQLVSAARTRNSA
jgi:nicotinate phosphoribosyltransferase